MVRSALVLLEKFAQKPSKKLLVTGLKKKTFNWGLQASYSQKHPVNWYGLDTSKPSQKGMKNWY